MSALRPTPLPFLTGDQRAFIDGVASVLLSEVTPQTLRNWPANAPRVRDALVGFGASGVLVPTAHAGLGLGAVEAVGLAVELGRVAAPIADPVLDSVIAGGVLARHGSSSLASTWLPRLAAGDASIAVVMPSRRYAVEGPRSSAVLVDLGGALRLVPSDRCTFVGQPSTDRLRDLSSVSVPAGAGELLSADDVARRDMAALGALLTAAQLVGLSSGMVAAAVEYAGQRRQFGVPIGSFQAVQHRLAESAVLLEVATVACYRAAAAFDADRATEDVAVARVVCGQAAQRISVHALQVFGGVGFTEEHHLHFWLKRAKALEAAFGSLYRHREAVAASLR